MNLDHVLYTYELAGGQSTCHAYGPASQADAQAAEEKLKAEFEASGASFAEFTTMVLPLEAMPA